MLWLHMPIQNKLYKKRRDDFMLSCILSRKKSKAYCTVTHCKSLGPFSSKALKIIPSGNKSRNVKISFK